MKSNISGKIKIAIFFLLAVGLLYFAFRGVDIQLIINGFRNVRYTPIFLALLVGFFSHVVRALRWKLLIEPLGYNPSLLNTLGALLIGYMANLAFPRIGEITRCGTLRKTDKIPFESLFGTVLVERAFDVIMMLILLVTVFFIKIDFFGKFLWDQALVPIWSKLTSLVVNTPFVFIAILILLATGIVLIKRNIFGQKFNNKVSSMFWGVVDGLKSVYTMKKRKAFFGYTILLWFLYWLMTWLLVFSTEPTSFLGPIDSFFLVVVGSVGMAAPVQGGFGAYHVITSMALGIYEISREDGLIFAIISHESQTILMILAGTFFMVLFFIKSRRKKL